MQELNENDFTVYEDGVPAAKWAVGLLLWLLGLTGGLCSIRRMRYSIGGDDIFLMVFGVAFLIFGIKCLQFSTNPRGKISNRELVLRRFWSVKRWRIEEVNSISVKQECSSPRCLSTEE